MVAQLLLHSGRRCDEVTVRSKSYGTPALHSKVSTQLPTEWTLRENWFSCTLDTEKLVFMSFLPQTQNSLPTESMTFEAYHIDQEKCLLSTV